MSKHNNSRRRLGRRGFLKTASIAAAGAAAFPHIWIPGRARASTQGFGTAKHLLYFRLSGGFRFPTCFNANVSSEFNPFGAATGLPEGVEWGMGSLLADDGWLTRSYRRRGCPRSRRSPRTWPSSPAWTTSPSRAVPTATMLPDWSGTSPATSAERPASSP